MKYIILIICLISLLVYMVSILEKYIIILFVILISIIVAYLIYELIFFITQRKPLSQDEILQLSKIRRIKYINNHYNFFRNTYNINPKYRSCLDKTGRWDRVSLPNNTILSFLTTLLKYKRHEWWVCVLADDNEGKLIWANKGPNNESCYFTGSQSNLLEMTKLYNCNTVIHIHNHPHTFDRYWNLLSPSETDLETSKILKKFYSSQNLNYIDALCTQGDFLIYEYSFETFFPKGTSEKEISLENNISPINNYKLHKEIRKGKNERINLG